MKIIIVFTIISLTMFHSHVFASDNTPECSIGRLDLVSHQVKSEEELQLLPNLMGILTKIGEKEPSISIKFSALDFGAVQQKTTPFLLRENKNLYNITSIRDKNGTSQALKMNAKLSVCDESTDISRMPQCNLYRAHGNYYLALQYGQNYTPIQLKNDDEKKLQSLSADKKLLISISGHNDADFKIKDGFVINAHAIQIYLMSSHDRN